MRVAAHGVRAIKERKKARKTQHLRFARGFEQETEQEAENSVGDETRCKWQSAVVRAYCFI